MVLASDLRKGNWVRSGDSVGRVSQLLSTEVELLIEKDGRGVYENYSYADLEAIRLTPEIITSCGFYKHELFPHRNAFHHKKFILNINVVGKIHEVSFGLIAENVAIIYQRNLALHQLQNLYYLLTNEELSVAPW
jgi:hypothetical protein